MSTFGHFSSNADASVRQVALITKPEVLLQGFRIGLPLEMETFVDGPGLSTYIWSTGSWRSNEKSPMELWTRCNHSVCPGGHHDKYISRGASPHWSASCCSGNLFMLFDGFGRRELEAFQQLGEKGFFQNLHVGIASCFIKNPRPEEMVPHLTRPVGGGLSLLQQSLDVWCRLRLGAEGPQALSRRSAGITFCVEHRRSGAQRRGKDGVKVWPQARSRCFKKNLADVIQRHTGWSPTTCNADITLVVSIKRDLVLFGLKLPKIFVSASPRQGPVLVREWLLATECPAKPDSRRSTKESKVCQLRGALRTAKIEVEQTQCELAWSRVASIPLPVCAGDFRLCQLEHDDAVFNFFSQLVCESCTDHRIDLHCSSFRPAPMLVVSRIEVVINPRLIKAYHAKMEEIQGLRSQGCSSIPPLAKLKIPDRKGSAPSLNYNEHFLFHGCPSAAVEEIVRYGFDPRRGGESAGKMFGLATYMALNASKADIYTEPFPTLRLPRQADRRLFIARALLGEAYRATAATPTATRPPDGSDGRPLDSVWADVRGNGGAVDHAEAMIYDKGQAYPEMLVTYSHRATCGCAECSKRPAF